MDLASVANPLRVLLRIAFVVVVVAAVAVDLWVLGDLGYIQDGELRVAVRPALLALLGIAAIGVTWARWPQHALACAAGAAVLSIASSTQNAPGQLRIGIFTELVVLPALFAAVLATRGDARWLIGPLVFVAAIATSTRVDDTRVSAVVAMSMLVLLGAAASAVVYIRLRDNERHASIATARHNERLDLARELHDVVGHHVTGIVVLAQASRFTAGAAPELPAHRALAEIEAAGLETLTSVRRLIGLLRTDPSTATGPRLTDVERIVEDLRSTHPSTDLLIDDALRRSWVPADLANTVQRLVQEAATNVRRHGDPDAYVRFRMGLDGARFELAVENRMLHRAADTGYGLIGMRERVEALGGTFAAGPTPQGTWLVHAVLPVSGEAR